MVKTQNPPAEIGWQATDFKLKATDGKHYTLDQVRGPSGLVVVFMCNHCPYVQMILQKIIFEANALKTYGIYTVGIMSNDTNKYPEDSFENMIKLHEEAQISFPYLIDETQDVAKQYQAVCTPDFYGFDKNLKLQYRGRLDSAGNSEKTGEERELYNAMISMAQDKNTLNIQHPTIGCSIKWKHQN